ncbi:snRNA binding protein [Aureococcus anophagefferens]|nr:snRNA binding protein [Aureococcus anophagefferens]
MAGRKMTPKGQMAFGGGPPITHLPPAMKAMFQPGPPLLFREKISKRRPTPYTGIAAYRDLFETTAPPEPEKNETPRERAKVKAEGRGHGGSRRPSRLGPAEAAGRRRAAHDRRRLQDLVRRAAVLRHDGEEAPARVRAVRRHQGPARRPRRDPDHEPMEGDDDALHAGTPRGYAFVEFERESDMRDAYKRADGRKIDGRRVLVDVERGRTVRNWRPRKLGGGLGSTRKRGAAPNNGSRPGGQFQPSRVVSSTPAYRRRAPVRQVSTGPPRRDRSRSRDRGRHRDDDRRRDRSRSRDRRR